MIIPVSDRLRSRRVPYVNWAIIAGNVAVFVYMLGLSTQPDQLLGFFRASETDVFFYDWGFVGACVAEQLGIDSGAPARELASFCPAGSREFVQPFTAMFVHAGFLHIFMNLLFLWIFGDNVEDSMGHGRYLVFYTLCGLAAAALQTAFTLDSTIPAVGASGAISGVMGAYLVMFPRATVQVIILPLFFLPFFVPAAMLIVVWFITQLFAGVSSLGEATAGSGVAWWAHVGGFIAGALLIWPFRRRRAGPTLRRY